MRITKNILLITFASFLLFGCDRGALRKEHSPGEVEVIDNTQVFHLANGFLIKERNNGSTAHFLIESTVAGYKLTGEGLNIKLEGKNDVTIHAAPAGYIAAWLTSIPVDGPEGTRFQVDGSKLSDFLQEFTADTTVQDVYSLKQ